MAAFAEASFAEASFAESSFTEASPQRAPAPMQLTAGLDPVVAQLLRAMESAYRQERRVILENIANVNSVGYYRRVVETSIEHIAGADGMTFQLPVVKRVARVFTCGTLEITQRQLDLAIDGDGFFSVLRLDGSIGYLRNGCLHFNADGKLVSNNGLIVTPEISVPADVLEIYVDPSGTVSGRTAGSPDSTTTFGQLNIHRFAHPNGLLFEHGSYRATDVSGQPTTATPGTNGLGQLKQGFLERSNVQMHQELMRLQQLERQHESVAQVLAHFGMVAP
tara:strand:- start:40 stop:873 length:834 start_codon:yes stop_codon:yes gene_type:complete